MELRHNYDLTTLNTFGVKATAALFTEINGQSDIPVLFAMPEFKSNERLFLGGGSNILFTKDFDGIVIKNNLKGIEIESEDEESVTIKAMSGETWHDLVMFAVERGLWGIENLSLIPGTVGGAPMQNIGAYGAELKETLSAVEVYEIETGEKKVFSKEECEFGYRDSIFKGKAKGKYFISGILLQLQKTEKKNITYKVLANHIAENNIEVKGVKDISDAVSDIRRRKLPDPKVLGNAGSFFKNVFVDTEKLRELMIQYPEIQHFEEGGVIKIPAGWLIEHAGPANKDGTSWKGKRIGNVGMHEKQALVLVNYGGATGQEIKTFAETVMASVYEKFGLQLSPEVNFM